MMLRAVCVVLCLATVAVSAQTLTGKCPDVKTQETVDLAKYLDLWFEIYKFPAPFEQGKCITANYTLKESGRVRVDNRYVDNGKEVHAIGEAYRPDDKEQGKLKVRFAPVGRWADYYIVDTDYTSYSLVYSCTDIGGVFHLDFAWILSRDMKLDEDKVTQLKTQLRSYGVDISKFTKTDQSGCPEP